MRKMIALVLLAVSVSLAPPSSAYGAATQGVGGQLATPPPAAYILVDNDSGNVLQAFNERTAMPPASITKLLTALVAAARLRPDDDVTIVGDGPQQKPALKIGLKQGEIWPSRDLMRALLMVSANDAAFALAEGISGSAPEFEVTRRAAALELGLVDNPRFNDPSGLDDPEWGVGGGDLVSARDMAIIARAALASPEIRQIIAMPRYDFIGPDQRPHHMLNHNGLLKRYPGAIGMKTGYTKKARKTLVAAATRDGRTMLAVVLGAENPEATATRLMDEGFAVPVSAQRSNDHLRLTTLKTAYAGDEVSAADGQASASGEVLNFPVVLFAVVAGWILWRSRRSLVRKWLNNRRLLTGQLD